MRAKYVIEKLKHEDNAFIVAKDYHEITLMLNALFDVDQILYKDTANLVSNEKYISE